MGSYITYSPHITPLIITLHLRRIEWLSLESTYSCFPVRVSHHCRLVGPRGDVLHTGLTVGDLFVEVME